MNIKDPINANNPQITSQTALQIAWLDTRYSDLRKAIHDKRAIMDSNILADSIVINSRKKLVDNIVYAYEGTKKELKKKEEDKDESNKN